MTVAAPLCNPSVWTRETVLAKVPARKREVQRETSLRNRRNTKAVVHCFTQLGFLADVYLDDFYGADSSARASTAFTALKQLLQELGLQTSPEKDSPPSTKQVCLGVNVDRSQRKSSSRMDNECQSKEDC